MKRRCATISYKAPYYSKTANEDVLRNRCSRGVLALENHGVKKYKDGIPVRMRLSGKRGVLERLEI